MPPVLPLPVSPLHQKSVPVVVTTDRGVVPRALNRVEESTTPAASTRAIVRSGNSELPKTLPGVPAGVAAPVIVK
jgi:hypothetical protein